MIGFLNTKCLGRLLAVLIGYRINSLLIGVEGKLLESVYETNELWIPVQTHGLILDSNSLTSLNPKGLERTSDSELIIPNTFATPLELRPTATITISRLRSNDNRFDVSLLPTTYLSEEWMRKHWKRTSAKALKKTVKSSLKTSLDVMKGATISTKITWYTGHDLLNPYCDRKSKWTPTDKSLVIAVTQVWKLRPKCGDFFELKVVDKNGPKSNGKSVIARVVDLCGGCEPEVPHADLSKAAFESLFDLDVGLVSGLSMRRVNAPKQWDTALFGPKLL